MSGFSAFFLSKNDVFHKKIKTSYWLIKAIKWFFNKCELKECENA